MATTAAGPCTPIVRSFSISLVRLGPVTKCTADGIAPFVARADKAGERVAEARNDLTLVHQGDVQ